jgi:hypothetical protein
VVNHPASWSAGNSKERSDMRADERELAALRLRQIADEVGLELSAERLEQLVGLLESTVDGTRSAADLELDELSPAFTTDVGDSEVEP